jgi:hypothetical protein
MVQFFFYNNLTNPAFIKNINVNFEIDDGHILIHSYVNNILEISDYSINNNYILQGKIVNFNMKIEDIIMKINEIKECRITNKIKYTIDTIQVNKHCGCQDKMYIIY